MSETSLPAVVAASIGGLVLHDACAAFCADLVSGGVTVYFSQIVRLEFSQVLFRLPHGVQLPSELRREYHLDRWDAQANVRRRWMRFGAREFEALVGRFAAVSEVAFDLPIWYSSIDVMARHRLRSHDAIHVATARASAVVAFATLDADFRRIPDLDVRVIR